MASLKQTILLMMFPPKKQVIQLILSKQATLLYSCAQTCSPHIQQLRATVRWSKPPLKLLQGHLISQAHLLDEELWILPGQRVIVKNMCPLSLPILSSILGHQHEYSSLHH